MIGTWIDGLDDMRKDRIVEDQDWGYGRAISRDGSRCLVGIVGDAFTSISKKGGVREVKIGDTAWWDANTHTIGWVAIRFDKLCHRFGMERIVRCVKLRAGAKVAAAALEAPKPEPCPA